jgi:hypothetical protein
MRHLRLHGARQAGKRDDRHVDCVLWGRGDPLMQLMAASSSWSIRYQDATSFVACRRDIAT